MAEGERAEGALELPSDDELVALLKESVQEVFTMITSQADEAVVRGEERASVDVETPDGQVETTAIDIEAIVSFHGRVDGHVVLRCSAQGALNLAQGLLMTEDGDVLQLEEISDALGECVNMVAGTLKTKALDPVDDFRLGLPEIHHEVTDKRTYRLGSLAYRLTDGLMAAELWLSPAA